MIGIVADVNEQETEQRVRSAQRDGLDEFIVFKLPGTRTTKYVDSYQVFEADNIENARQILHEKQGTRSLYKIPEQRTCEASGVAVIITCHNYAHFLAECLESILDQTVSAAEILVVDDASTDNTKEVTLSFSKQGVQYLRVENLSSHFSRRDGVLHTEAEIVLFVDADDTLSSDYIECGLAEFTDQDVGVVYADHQHFGDTDHRRNFPEYTQDKLFKGPNFVSTCSFIRREALQLCRAWDRDVDLTDMPCDYWLFTNISLDGWEFKKQKAVLNYRRHSVQMSQKKRTVDSRKRYYQQHGLENQTVTLYVPLAGRKWAWNRLSKFLDRQEWPHDQIKLILCDTSQDAEFSKMIRTWMAGCDYGDVRHFQLNAGTQGLADLDRRENAVYCEVKQSICKIYNQLRLMLETPYCWILEDDIVPPDDVLERLLKHFTPEVATVTAPYQSRFVDEPVIWVNDPVKNKVPLIKAVPPKPGDPQVTEVRGSGFGCLVARSEVVKQHVLALPPSATDLDPYWFSKMGDEWRRLCDWSCRVEHWDKDRVYLIGENNNGN